MKTWMKQVPQGWGEKDTPTFFSSRPAGNHSQACRTVRPWHLHVKKGKDDLEDPAILPVQQHQSPKASHRTGTSKHTPPTGRNEDIQAARETLRSSSRGGKSTLQSPASVSSSCQATSMCSCSCRCDSNGRRNRRTKRTFGNRLWVPGRWVGSGAIEADPLSDPRSCFLRWRIASSVAFVWFQGPGLHLSEGAVWSLSLCVPVSESKLSTVGELFEKARDLLTTKQSKRWSGVSSFNQNRELLVFDTHPWEVGETESGWFPSHSSINSELIKYPPNT